MFSRLLLAPEPPGSCRIREELVERDHVEDTKLQMQKRRREGMTKQRKVRGGEAVTVARLDAKRHRRTSRSVRKVLVRQMLDSSDDEDF